MFVYTSIRMRYGYSSTLAEVCTICEEIYRTFICLYMNEMKQQQASALDRINMHRVGFFCFIYSR